MTPNQEQVERWLDEKTTLNDDGSTAREYFTPSEIKFIAHQKALSRAAVLEEIRGKIKGLDCSFCNYESEVKLRLDELEEKIK